MEFHRDFKICHYAGDVIYNVNGFIDKNRDTLFQDFKRLLYNRYGLKSDGSSTYSTVEILLIVA